MNTRNKTNKVIVENSQVSHSIIAKIFHWGFIAVFFYALTKQLDEVEELENTSLLYSEIIFATIFLLLLFIRYVYMRIKSTSALPKDSSAIVKFMAKLVHTCMYIALSMIAITGLGIGALYWYGIKSGAVMNAMLLSHEIFVNSSFILIGLHISAALYHRFLGDGVWNSMVPIWKEKNKT